MSKDFTSILDFSRQIKVAGMSAEKQTQIEQAKVAIFGAGGLGVTAISYLTAAGIGHITVIDPDHIEASNLHRQILYRPSDIGQKKASMATQFALQQNPAASISAITEKADLAQIRTLFEQHDLVLDCTDDIAAGYVFNDIAWHTKTPVVFANAAALNGQLFNLIPEQDNACLRCLWPESNQDGATCDGIGVLGPVPGALGCLQALEALKILAEIEAPLRNAFLHFDFQQHRYHKLALSKEPDCEHQLTWEQIQDRHALYQAQFEQTNSGSGSDSAIIIDIREAHEVAEMPFSFTDQCIPMSVLMAHPQDYLEDDQCYQLVCSRGIRSANAAVALRETFGYDVFPYQDENKS